MSDRYNQCLTKFEGNIMSKKKKLLIIDDNPLWMDRAEVFLGDEFEIFRYLVAIPDSVIAKMLLPDLLLAIQKAEILLIAGSVHGVSCTPLMCTIRHSFQRLPIVRWSLANDESDWVTYLQVSCIRKPTHSRQDSFLHSLHAALLEQKFMLGNPATFYDLVVADEVAPGPTQEMSDMYRIFVSEIAQLAHQDEVSSQIKGLCSFTVEPGPCGSFTKDTIREIVCCGYLSYDDILPHLKSLQVVVKKIRMQAEVEAEYTEAFDLIEKGDLHLLELIRD